MRGDLPQRDRRPLCRHLPLLKTELFLRYEEDELPELIDALLAELLRQQLVEARDGGYWVNPATRCACCAGREHSRRPCNATPSC